MKPLDKLGAGERAYIVDMKNSILCQKLFEMGVFPGDIVEVTENSKSHNSIVVKIKNRSFRIYRQAAETVITHVVNFEFNLN